MINKIFFWLTFLLIVFLAKNSGLHSFMAASFFSEPYSFLVLVLSNFAHNPIKEFRLKYNSNFNFYQSNRVYASSTPNKPVFKEVIDLTSHKPSTSEVLSNPFFADKDPAFFNLFFSLFELFHDISLTSHNLVYGAI